MHCMKTDISRSWQGQVYRSGCFKPEYKHFGILNQDSHKLFVYGCLLFNSKSPTVIYLNSNEITKKGDDKDSGNVRRDPCEKI